MARYFFHIVSRHAVMPDHQGRECSCAEDAFFHARRIVHEAAQYLSVVDDRRVVRVRTAEDNFTLDVLFSSCFSRLPISNSMTSTALHK